MMNYYLLTGLAAIGLVACTNDSVVNPKLPDATSDVPMLFDYHMANMGRATTALQSELYEFGVYAVKANSQANMTTVVTNVPNSIENNQLIMNNYMVGYYNGSDEGYQPKAGQNHDTNWYYEGLGYDSNNTPPEEGYTFVSATKTAKHSTNTNQYLKYWDLSKIYTYFYAYTPYGATTFTANRTKTTLTLPEVDANSTSPYMYAIAKCTNADHNKVVLTFNKMQSQIRLAFYHVISGYDVELINFSTSNEGVIFMPATFADPTYSTGSYITSGTPTVTFVEGEATGYNYSDETTASTDLEFDLDNFKNNSDAATKQLGETYANRIYSETKNEIPQDACGFTLNVSFKLTAKDTKEVINVKGAKVFVAPSFTKWEANKRYTYVFRITNTVQGSTSATEPTPGVEPNSNQALYPIVFENVTVAEMSDADDKEWDLQSSLDPGHDPRATH